MLGCLQSYTGYLPSYIGVPSTVPLCSLSNFPSFLSFPSLAWYLIPHESGHDSVNTRGPTALGLQVQSPLEVNFLLNLFCFSLRSNTKCQICQLCVITEKQEYARMLELYSLLSERNMASCNFYCLCFCICCYLFQCHPHSGDTEKLLRKCEQFRHIL